MKMRSTLISILLVVFLMFSGASVFAQSNEAVDFNTLSITFVNSLLSKDYNSCFSMFDETMKKALPLATLEAQGNMVLAQAGKFERALSMDFSEVQGYTFCLFKTEHENIVLVIQIYFDSIGQVASLAIGFEQKKIENTVIPEGIIEEDVVIGEGTKYPLNGKLTMPENFSGKLTAVVLSHGSGSSDMNETAYGYKTFEDIAYYLARHGIAVLRYDKINFSYGAQLAQEYASSFTVKEEAIDTAVLAFEVLANDSRIDTDSIYLLGHSLSGMLAPRIVSEEPGYCGMILFAGSPRNLYEIMYDQQILSIKDLPLDDQISYIMQIEDWRLLMRSFQFMSDDEAKSIDTGYGTSGYYYKDLDSHSAEEYLSTNTKPVLILQGENDFQVLFEKDYARYLVITKGMDNVSAKSYPNLNHFFATSTADTPEGQMIEYGIGGKVDSNVLYDIVYWILNENKLP